MRIAISKKRQQHPVQEHTNTHTHTQQSFSKSNFHCNNKTEKVLFLTKIFQFKANSMDNYVSTNIVCGTQHAICHLADIDDCQNFRHIVLNWTVSRNFSKSRYTCNIYYF